MSEVVKTGERSSAAAIHGGARGADEPGLRARNKLDKLKRIRAAAQELFVTRGYDDATVREIARTADIGLGTLFAYAADKRDLLFLIVNDDLEAAAVEARRMAEAEAPVLDQLGAIFRLHYDLFGRQPTLARYVLRELLFYKATEQAARFQATREGLIALIEGLLDRAKAARTIAPAIDTPVAARVIFSVYQSEVRRWLASEPLELDLGLVQLRVALELLWHGLVHGPDDPR